MSIKLPIPEGKKPNAYWNGDLAYARPVVVKVGTVEKPTWWCAGMEGQPRKAVQVFYAGESFFLDNEEGKGWLKVTFGYGDPQYGHSGLPDDSEVLETSDAYDDWPPFHQLEAKRQEALVSRGLVEPPEKDFREFHDELRQIKRRVWVRKDKSTYVRPEPKLKGKKAKRAAKREKVQQMKAAQSNTGGNETADVG